jgi:hypothetical protein
MEHKLGIDSSQADNQESAIVIYTFGRFLDPAPLTVLCPARQGGEMRATAAGCSICCNLGR